MDLGSRGAGLKEQGSRIVAFRDGLLQARGQIVFIFALAVSTGVIIYLESLDTDSRIRSRVQESLVQERRNAAPQEVRDRASAALRRAEEAYGAAPNAAESRAGLLAALAGATQLGSLDREPAQTRAEAVLRSVEADQAPPAPVLAGALSATAAAFPDLQDRIARLPTP
jgi:hypothetical protein